MHQIQFNYGYLKSNRQQARRRSSQPPLGVEKEIPKKGGSEKLSENISRVEYQNYLPWRSREVS